VLLFLHGGGFREGDRAQYGFVATPFAKHGIITVVASYRLTGEGFTYPAQTEDAKLAMQWLYANIASYGGDPQRLFMSGHSAGAILAADLGANRSWMTDAHIPKTAFRGIAPVSGRFDLRIGGRPGESDVYAPTPDLAQRASPLLHVTDLVPTAVIAVGSTENAESFIGSSEAMARKLTQSGTKTQYLLLEHADHKDTALAIADERSALFKAILAIIEAPSA
jgi:acetyl esterase/lipase